MQAVRFSEYGGIGVLQVAEVPVPEPGEGEVLVAVRAAGINPGEAKIRAGLLHSRWPATFPSGQGSDLAGVVTAAGAGVAGVAAGDEVIGYTDSRASHAQFAAVPAGQLTPRPAAVPWEVAGSLHVAGCTAWAAVRAVAAGPGDTVVVAGAAGGVGSITVQLARLAGATVIGIAGPANHDWLTARGVTPVGYDGDVAAAVRAAAPRADAFIDTFGAGYVQLAVGLGISPDRIDTIADFGAAEKFGVRAEGNAAGASAAVLAELAALVAAGRLEVPVAAAFPLADVRDAYRLLEQGHTRGKIVLLP